MPLLRSAKAPGIGLPAGQATTLTSFSVSGVPMGIDRAATTTCLMPQRPARGGLLQDRTIDGKLAMAAVTTATSKHDEVAGAAVHVISFTVTSSGHVRPAYGQAPAASSSRIADVALRVLSVSAPRPMRTSRIGPMNKN